ncbi:MAG: hypothetical protein K0R66_170 [Gammaproteobacteria bacterium]|jgi:hypothetical protein|nr:hypothetical protein [Gammaproteobacteria bacterium]
MFSGSGVPGTVSGYWYLHRKAHPNCDQLTEKFALLHDAKANYLTAARIYTEKGIPVPAEIIKALLDTDLQKLRLMQEYQARCQEDSTSSPS